MKLSLIQDVCADINSQHESQLADAILQLWDHDPGSARFWRASANFVFFFKFKGQGQVLRFVDAAGRSLAQIEAELEFVSFLADAGVRLARPCRSKAGSLVEHHTTLLGVFHAVVFEAASGVELDFGALNTYQFVRWGAALGALHNRAARFTKPGRITWQQQLDELDTQLKEGESAARVSLTDVTSRMRSLPATRDTFGLIHGDFELDNLIWSEDRGACIIDFDDCSWNWFAADVAFALRDLFNDDPKLFDENHLSYRAFISGYRAQRGIEPDDLANIPLFMRFHNLIRFGRLLTAATPPQPGGELSWIPELRTKLVGKIAGYRARFS